MEKAISSRSPMKILMFPWLAHGHMFAFLELAKRILKRKSFHIYFCSTPINFPSIKNFIQKNNLHERIEFLELHLDSDELPPHYHTTKNLPSHLNHTLLKILQTAYPAFSHIVTTLNPDLVIYDRFQPWAAKVVSSEGHKIPAVFFCTTGACVLSYYHHKYNHGKALEFPFPAIKFDESALKSVDNIIEYMYSIVFDVDQDFLFGNFKQSCELVLVKTSLEFEGQYIDYLSTLSKRTIIPVGPMVRVDDYHADCDSDDMIIQWLDKRNPNSTVYISFGSEYFLSKEDIEQMANALDKLSCYELNFIWIIRFPVGLEVSLESVLPEGFLERVEERGLVSSGFAPQIKILSHPNTGAFVSHCGWSSIMESVYLGVPVVAMPMKLDQPFGGRVLSEAGCGVEVPRRENEWYSEGDIAEAIQKVIVEESGEGMRQRAKELSMKLRMEEEEEMDRVAEELWQLCLRHKNQVN